MDMNFLDIIIAVPLVYFIYKGWRRGLIFELASLAGIVAGCYAATHFSGWVAQTLHLEGETAILIAFFITFVGVLALAAVLGKAVEGFVKLVKAGKVNNLLGAAFGMLKCLCVLSVLLNMLTMADPEGHIITSDTREHSALYKPAVKAGTRLTAHLRLMVEQQRTNK
ncbi:MAG: membrane protein required for colicin V production [bacterium P3]|nr:MAG: membrane protein required for colicin V production [bacterium P3]KWW40664.1 MAG: membrane protein required for colicin V production [bacterium F083]